MERLLPGPSCRDCLMDLAGQAATVAAGGNPHLLADAREAAKGVLESTIDSGLTSPEVANRMVREISLLTGMDDPFEEIKAREMALAREVYERVRPRVGNDLASKLALAALGNSLDFFVGPEEAMARLREVFDRGFSFYHDDTPRLEQLLAGRPDRIVYLTDNAGEIYFDLPLYECLSLSAGEVVLTVKGGPGLNDLTRAEIEAAGLSGLFGRIADTGTAGAGIEWAKVSADFLELIEGADLILSKGMANMETLSVKELPTPALMLFKVKCRPVQEYLDAPADTFWALWRKKAA